MNILVTGGTGFLGRALAHRLQSLSANVTIIGRNTIIGQQLQQAGLRFIYADLADAPAINTACRHQDYVFHCGALSAPWGRFEDFYAANVLGTQNVIQGCLAHNVKRLIHLSTPAIHFDYHDKLNLSEHAPLPRQQINGYAQTKYMAEQAIDAAHEQGLPVITLRPRAIFGPGDTSLLPRLLEKLSRGQLPIIGNGQNMTDLTYIDNVVEAMLLCLESPPATLGCKYYITNGEPIKLWPFIQHLSEQLGYPPPQRHVPRWLAYQVAGMMERYWDFSPYKVQNHIRAKSSEPPLTRYAVGLLATTFTLDITAARQELGYQPKINMEEALAQTLRYGQE